MKPLNWLNEMGSENTFDVDCRDGCAKKKEVEKLLRYRGSVIGDSKDGFMNKQRWNKEVKNS